MLSNLRWVTWTERGQGHLAAETLEQKKAKEAWTERGLVDTITLMPETWEGDTNSHHIRRAVVLHDLQYYCSVCFNPNVELPTLLQRIAGSEATPQAQPLTYPLLHCCFCMSFCHFDNSQRPEWTNQSTVYIILASLHVTTTVHSILVRVTGPLVL